MLCASLPTSDGREEWARDRRHGTSENAQLKYASFFLTLFPFWSPVFSSFCVSVKFLFVRYSFRCGRRCTRRCRRSDGPSRAPRSPSPPGQRARYEHQCSTTRLCLHHHRGYVAQSAELTVTACTKFFFFFSRFCLISAAAGSVDPNSVAARNILRDCCWCCLTPFAVKCFLHLVRLPQRPGDVS